MMNFNGKVAIMCHNNIDMICNKQLLLLKSICTIFILLSILDSFRMDMQQNDRENKFLSVVGKHLSKHSRKIRNHRSSKCFNKS